MQEEGEQCANLVDKIERYLLDFAKLSEDVNLRKQALDRVLAASTEVPEEEVASLLETVLPEICSCVLVSVGAS